MKRRHFVFAAMTLTAALTAGMPSTLAADMNVLCVQEEFNALGYDAGTADGLMGRKTLAAAESYASSDGSLTLAALDAGTAETWCKALAEQHPELAPYAFALTSVEIEFGPGVSDTYKGHIEEGAALAFRFFREELGMTPRGPVRIFASSDMNWLADRNIEINRLGASARANIIERYQTTTAEAGLGWVIVNTGLDSYSMPGYLGNTRAQRLQLLAHELFHTQQFALAGDRARRYVTDSIGTQTMGPNWLIEGSADYVGYALMEELGVVTIKNRYAADRDRVRDWKQNGAAPLSGYETKRQTGLPLFWDVSRVGVQELVAQHGMQGLPVFWEELGKGAHWEDAFITAFDTDVGAFYDAFHATFGREPVERRIWKTADSPAPSGTATDAQPAAGQDANALFQKGSQYDAGNGVAKDDEEAAKWYLMAAELGHAAAQRNLAGMYGSGRGVARDDAEARRWFTAAAENGDAQGQYALATWYLSDTEERVAWLRKAAAQGHKEAISSLKTMNVPLTDPTPEAGTSENTAGSALPVVAPIDPAIDPRNGVECVQRQLNALGFDAGTPDGIMGSRTAAASRAYLEQDGATWTRDPVSAQTGLKWCLMIADEHPEFMRLWWNVKPETVDQAVFSDLPGEFAYAIRKTDTRLNRSELEAIILDHDLVFDWGGKTRSTLVYRRSGDLLANGELQGKFVIADDGEACLLQNGKKDECRLYLMHHGMLLQTNALGERWIPEISAAD